MSRRITSEFIIEIKLLLKIAADIQEIYRDVSKLSNISLTFERPKFAQVSVEISLLFPKPEENLFEIDDLMYPSHTTEAVTSKEKYSKVSCPKMIQECRRQYLYILNHLSSHYFNFMLDHRQAHTTLIQLIESSRDDFEDDYYEIQRLIGFLVNGRSILSTCLAIKILKAVVKTNADYYLRDEQYTKLWLSNMLNIPQAKCLAKKKITSWISTQIEFIWKHLNFDNVEKYLPVVEFSDTLDENQYDNFSYHMGHLFWADIPKAVDQSYRYFMSATDEADKIKRLKSFFTYVYKQTYDEIRAFKFYEELKGIEVVLKAANWVFAGFDRYLKRSITILLHSCTDDQIKEAIDKHLCYDFKPYFSRHPTSSSISSDTLADSKILPTSEEYSVREEDDFVLEKFLFFDTYVKYLRLVEIVFTACRNSAEILGLEGGECANELIRTFDSFQFVWINWTLQNPTKRIGVPWWLHAMIKFCPFMIVKNEDECTLGDYVRMMKGEPIDEAVEEKLHFIVNNSFDANMEISHYQKFETLHENFDKDGD